MSLEIEIRPQAVRAQVARILASETFVRCRRMQRFLTFVVEETLAGRASLLGEYGIGVAVFDRGEGFEPALDPIVRNDARRLRVKLLEYYSQPQPRSADTVVIEMPKGGYVPVFLRVASRDRWSNAQSDLPLRLAVLPFNVLSMERGDVMDSCALCMSITAALTELDGVEAIAHGYLHELPIREAASRLRLSHAIHGSVFKSSNGCRIVINLIRSPDGAQLWAREYDFEGSEMIQFHSEITRAVLREVTVRLGLRQPQPTLAAEAA